MFKVPEKYRVKNAGAFSSTEKDGNNGLFVMGNIKIIASDGGGWDHVSVSLSHRTPTWAEMSKVKDLFWSDDECVVQYHPKKIDYINTHNNCLHLWRNQTDKIITPPKTMV